MLVLALSIVPSAIAGAAAFGLTYAGGAGLALLDLLELVNVVIQQILSVFAALVMIGSLAEAYRQLNGPGIAVPESVLSVFDDA